MRTVLIAEDEKAIREFVTINLKFAGYDVFEAENGKRAIELFDEYEDKIDVAVLDIMMPECDGVEVCKHIRDKNQNTGIIFLSAKAQEQDKVSGLVSGADDYITKPFSPTELLARIEVILRRIDYSKNLIGNSASDIIEIRNYRLDLKKHCLYKNGNLIELTHTEFRILEYFFNNPETTVDRVTLLSYVWGDPHYGDDKLVDVNIRRLRLKIEDNPSNPVHLITVWGHGYRWN